MAFYKGNGVRVLHIYVYSVLRNDLGYYFDNGESIFRKDSFIRDFAAATIASMFLHPLHLAEARLILQNRLPNF